MTSAQRRSRSSFRIVFAALLLSAVSGATALARNPLKLPDTQYEPITWNMIEGWADDDHTAAFASFLKSCQAILKGTPESRPGQPMYAALFRVCEKAGKAEPQKPGAARAFFEQNFRPVRISPLGSPDGFVTGYYEPIVDGTRTKGEGYDYPLYRKPASLLPGGRMAVAGISSGEGKKKKRSAKRRFAPFYDRAAIDDGVLDGRDLEICWLKDPIDSFFIHIQGSVRVVLDDGKLMRLNYQAANGHPYYAVGRYLIERNIVPKDEMSMDRIREWMERNPAEGRELRRRNKSYVFFRETHLPANQEPIGAQGVSLTPGRSIAVDRKLHTYGTPFFISAYLPIEGLKPDTWFRRLMIAQDTGGAIVGPARADLYFGAGDEAASISGRLRHEGRFVMLAPKELIPVAGDDEIPLPRPRPVNLEAEAAVAEHATEVKSEPAKSDTAKSGKSESGKSNIKLSTKAQPAKLAAKKPEKKLAKLAEKKAEKTVEKESAKKKSKREAKSSKRTTKFETKSKARHDPST